MSQSYKIEFIDNHNSLLTEVIKLGDANSRTLGHLPQVVYQEYARKKCILVARNGNKLLGHCLIRKTQKSNQIKIAQLCISQEFRGNGLADKIINHLKSTFKNDFKGIGLNCRNDYEYANKLWRRCNFIPLTEKAGRAKTPSILTYWYYNFNKKDLFSILISKRVRALLDTNIIIKYRDADVDTKSPINALFTDYMTSEIDYYYASETLVEIQRDKNQDRRKKTREILKQFNITKNEKDLVSEITNILSPFFNLDNPNDRSDCNQIGQSIIEGIEFFITTDTGLINKRNLIAESYPIEILSPIEFIVQIDSITNSERYVGNKLAGTQYELTTAQKEDISLITQQFINSSQGEKKSHFKSLITSYCFQENTTLKTIKRKNEIHGVWAYSITKECLQIECLRLKRSALSFQLYKQIIRESIQLADQNNVSTIVLNENTRSETEKDILNSYYFNLKDKKWTKQLVREIYTSTEFIKTHPKSIPMLKKSLNEIAITNEDKYNLERRFYPLKLVDLEIPTYIIPIKSYWASQLFDYYSAQGSLFGAKPKLIWNRENIYYRSVKPNIEKAPSRILWYASHEPNNDRSKAITAVSYIDQIHIDTAKQQFKRFEKYGVYEWRNIFDLAKSNPESAIKAIQFSDTEVFKNVLRLDDLKLILDKNITLQSPIKIDNSSFIRIYRKLTSK